MIKNQINLSKYLPTSLPADAVRLTQFYTIPKSRHQSFLSPFGSILFLIHSYGQSIAQEDYILGKYLIPLLRVRI